MSEETRPVGVFDSGRGGISTLIEAARLMPWEDFIYYGDQKYAPYGTRDESYVLERAENVTRLLIGKGIKALVIACNTATAAAAKTLRAEYDFPIIGMEPAVKPASLVRTDGLVLCLATPGTLKSEKFHLLLDRFGAVTPLPCPGLMELVERGPSAAEETDRYLKALFAPYAHKKTDAVVLGCTHYVFIRDRIVRCLPPGTPVLDGNAGTARQLRRRLEECGLTGNTDHCGSVTFLSSAGEEAVRGMEELWRTETGKTGNPDGS